ncbi:MAG: SBBP repeat-containing protein [Gammaproteobacteria bacterium]
MRMFNLLKSSILLLAVAFFTYGTSAAAWIEPNVGQSADQYNYVIRANGLTALVAGQHVDFLVPVQIEDHRIHDPLAHAKVASETRSTITSQSLRLELVNANEKTTAKSGARLESVSNYFNGDASQWRSGVPHLSHARVNNVYTGVDVVYRLNDERLEYDFEVAPGADAGQIQLKLHGTQNMSITETGEWIAGTASGELRQLAPVVFQTVNGKRQSVAGEFAINDDGIIRFELAEHDKEHTLVIDPIIEFSGYVGGSTIDSSHKLLESTAGNYLLLGTTLSVDLAGTTPDQLAGVQDVFVMELDATTGTPNWVTILGGSKTDNSEEMALDSAGNIVIVGYTNSDDYPTLNAFQPDYVGASVPESASFEWDATITKLSADGANLVFSTYMGGADADLDTSGYFGFELLRGVAIDGSDNIYVAGQTSASDFPVTTTIAGLSCMEADVNAEATFTSDIVFAKFTPTGDRIMSACIGGTERDAGREIVLGPNEDVYISGFARSPDLPGTTGFFQPLPAAEFTYSPFVIKLNSELDGISFATYVGEGILQKTIIDSAGDIYGSGTAFTDLFPVTPGAFQTTYLGGPANGGEGDAFAFKLNADAMSLDYATYLGGTNDEDFNGVALDAQGRLYLAGITSSVDFPLKNEIGDTVGQLLTGSTQQVSIPDINHMRTTAFNDDNFFGFFRLVARNGVNLLAANGQSDALGDFFELGTGTDNTSDILQLDLDGDGQINELIATNKDAANEIYRWNTTSQSFDFLGTQGLASSDSRAAAKLFPFSSAGSNYAVAIANYGQSNQIVGLVDETTSQTVSLDFGRPDGNTTTIETGTVGPSFGALSIVVGNENQDIRLYSFGSGTLSQPYILNNNPGAVSALEIGDVNGDGENDVVTASLDGPVEVILFNLGLPAQTITLPETASGENTDVLLIDIDFDGDQDLLVGRLGNDLVFENTGGGTLVLESELTVGVQNTKAFAQLETDDTENRIFTANSEGIARTIPGRETIALAVLNPSGTDIEFSSYLPSDGPARFFRGIDLSSDSRVLLAGSTTGDGWPRVNSSANNAGDFDAVYMVLNLDQDGDGVFDGNDNCLLVANPLQRDSNMDGFGNFCDPDLNNDGTVNFVDVSLFASLFLSDDEDADLDGDGTVTFLDFAILSDFFLLPPGPGLNQTSP